METDKTVQRQYYMDWLRFICIALIIPFHAFVTHTFDGITYIKAGDNNSYFSVFNAFLRFWFMPLLFFISGSSSLFALTIRNHRQYLKQRLAKLLVPLIFGTLTIVSIQSYIRAISTNRFKGNFFEFYPHFFNSPYPHGNFDWGQFWFLAYLFTFSLLLLPVFLYFKNKSEKKNAKFLSKIFNHRIWMYVPALYFIITQALLRPGWPGFVNLYNDWANVALYGGLFFFGYIFSLHQNAKNIVSKNWFISLALAILSASAIFFIEQKFHLTPGYNIEYMAFKGLHGLNTYLWVIFFIGFGGKFINKSNSFLNYVRNFSFPLYMIHLIPITILDYYFLSLTISVYLKVSIVIITTYIFSLFFYELFIKRITIMRFLFGLKVKKKET